MTTKSHLFLLLFPLFSFAQQTYPDTKIVMDSIDPVLIEEREGYYFYDFGKTYFGTIELTFPEKVKETEIRLGEKLDSVGNIDRKPPGSVRYSSNVLPKGSYEHYILQLTPDKRNTGPRAIHVPQGLPQVMPFRYVEVASKQKPIVKMLAMHYTFDDSASYFKSDNEILNQVYELCKHTLKATSFLGIFVDGDRERIPYEADAYINQLSWYSVSNDYEIIEQTIDHLMLNGTWPTEWQLHMPMMVWEHYLMTRDTAFLKKHYEMCKKKSLNYLFEEQSQLIETGGKEINQKILGQLHIDRMEDIVDWPRNERDNFEFCPINAVVNAFYIHNLYIIKNMATVLENHDDQLDFDGYIGFALSGYSKYLWDQDRQLVNDGNCTEHSSFHANVMGQLYGDVDPWGESTYVQDRLHKEGWIGSVYMAQYVLELLSYIDINLALELITSKSERSWYNMIEQGSTMTMEAWNQDAKPNQDWNHAWATAPINFLVRDMMGLRPNTNDTLIKFHPKDQNVIGSYNAKVPFTDGYVVVEYQRDWDEEEKVNRTYTVEIFGDLKIDFRSIASKLLKEKDTDESQKEDKKPLIGTAGKKYVFKY